MRFQLHAAVRTHVGKIRDNNEDNFYLQGTIREDVARQEMSYACTALDTRFLAAVADGMGGETAGELASLLAVQALRPSIMDRAEDTARQSVTEANRAICDEIEKNGGRRMGSTLAAFYIDEGKILCCNIGDSRCYRLREGKLELLSTDHNKAGRMVEMGVLTPEQAARHPSRHELTQHLGIFEEEMIIEPAFCGPEALQPGDIFLLCSDGLTDMVTEADITACLLMESSPEEKADKLVSMALEGGGKDNVTVLVVQTKGDKRSLIQRIFSLKG